MTVRAFPSSDRIRLSAKQMVVSISVVGAALGLLALATRSGGSVDRPVGHRVYEIGITLVAAVILGAGVRQSVQARRLSPLLLMSVAAGTAFWQETCGDWGTYLLYSDRFFTYDWGRTAWTAPVACWWFIAGYVVFYTPLFQSLIAVVNWARRRWPHRNPYIAAALMSLPIFYAFDLLFEGTTVGFGYWNYEYVFGPSLHVGNGTFPLLWPIIEQVPFMALAAFLLTWRNSSGEDTFELAARVVLRHSQSQIALLTSWIIIINATFLTTTILPLMALRWIAGPDVSSVL